MNEAQWFERIQRQIEDGQYFLAFDTYREAEAAQVASLRLTLLGVLALLRSGAIQEARRLLAPLEARLESGLARSRRIARSFREAVAAAQAPAGDEAGSLDRALGQFLQCLGSLSGPGEASEADDPEILRLIGQIQVEIWSRVGDRAALAQASLSAEQAYQLGKTLPDGLTAAALAAMTGEPARAHRLIETLAGLWPEPPNLERDAVQQAFQYYAMRAEAALLVADVAGAQDALTAAAALRPRPLAAVVATLKRLDLLASAGVAVPAALRTLLRPPSAVVFAGQALDRPGCSEPSFPPWLEAEMARAIGAELDALGVEIGFSSAAAGAELLFVEAMLDRGAEYHLFLPFNMEDFIRYRVAYAGGNWERRFHNACKLAASITFATEEPYLGHASLLRFNSHLIQGMARARSAHSLSEPHLLVVWDYAAESGPGSVSDFIDNWSDSSRVRLIDLDDLRTGSQPAPGWVETLPGAGASAESVFVQPERSIRTMLFADLVGYSKLAEADLPRLWRCMDEVKALLAASSERLRLIESWGDAIYAVMDNSLDMADYAFALIDMVARMDTAGAGISRALQVRIGLHAGPVFEGAHPLTGRPIVYGSHVSRAARIEPVSLPGHVYASQQFVAMLLAEENAQRHEATMTGQPYAERYLCEYLGMLSLAKNYGRQQVYHLRRRPPAGLLPAAAG